MKDFGMREMTGYPHIQKGVRGLTTFLGDGGRWATFASDLGGFVTFHNLDGYREWLLGFNLASDVVEMIDDEIETPKVLLSSDGFSLRYPLPQGHDLLDTGRYPDILSVGWLQKRFDIAGLGKVVRVTADESTQEIAGEKGKITVASGVCTSSGFEGWDAYKPGFVISQLMIPFIVDE